MIGLRSINKLRSVNILAPDLPLTFEMEEAWRLVYLGCLYLWRQPWMMFLPVPSNHREGDEEAIQHPCRAWNSALEQIHEQHLRAVEQARQHYPGCWAVPGSGRRAQAMLRQAALTRMYVKKSSGVSMSEVGCVAQCSFGFPFHSGASNWAPKWRWHMAQADLAVKVSEPSLPCILGLQVQRKGKRERIVLN